MNNNKNRLAHSLDCSAQAALLLVVMLVLADVGFVTLHLINSLTPFPNDPLFSLEKDRGYPEVYQYLKWFWIVLLFGYLALLRRSPTYLAWALVFAYFLADDALALHERVGALFAAHLDIAPPFGLRVEDIGELAASAAMGVLLLAFVCWSYLAGRPAFKKISHDTLLLIGALVFFGVGFDMAHVILPLGEAADLLFGVLEDGGEMLVASATLSYVLLLGLRPETDKAYLFDYLRARWANRRRPQQQLRPVTSSR
ncbi:hypothetical protein DN824_19995 [Stutzerimonas nosocomialis]|uniref:Uncharacterized protein n=1 Tax=Stutzerimonas nosocomialis TaxID=1056496 RepID=A0A5R9Q7V9_9GAMM|nr:hypothetical protein [Stutzerimonas nosocomialis]TLX55182.1 hypothetical protein DN824_19995 [Stutzerimonas nosocomialis]TLX60030.1 hypothetical protein DN820_21950 [Stutzerimonas nosocomialis]